MTIKIGFSYLNAAILQSGILDTDIGDVEKYKTEKMYVSKLLNAYHEISVLDEPTFGLMIKLIEKELNQWWVNSWYNVQIDNMRIEIMNFLRAQLEKKEIDILSMDDQKIVIAHLSDEDFTDIQQIFDSNYENFDLYYE